MVRYGNLVLFFTMCFVLQASAESLKMNIGGKPWRATTINSTIVPMGKQMVFSITGKLEGEKISKLSFQIVPLSPDNPVGHYDLKRGAPPQNQASGGFNGDLTGGDPLEDSLSFQSGALEVTAYDASNKILTGNFSGILTNRSGTLSAEVKNGVLDGIEIAP